MNDEMNNNHSSEYTDSNNFPNNYTDNKVVQNNDQNFDNSNTTVEYNVNGNTNQMNIQIGTNENGVNENVINENNTVTYPQIKEEKKQKTKKMKTKKIKTKKKGFSIFKLTAAAIAFGVLAGAAFQGYFLVMNAMGYEVSTNRQNEIKIAEVTNTTNSGDTIIPTGNNSTDSVVTDVSSVVNSVMPSIVAINSQITNTSYDFFGREYLEQGEGSGSGIIIAQNNGELLIVTNNHVIEGATKVEVVFSNEEKVTAEVKGSDANADLAILSVNMSDLTEETIATIKVASLGNSEDVQSGDMAIAIGNALGYGQSVTVGYISAVNREVTIDNNTMTLLQTDAAINPGNSGGALLNISGQVIGINSVKYASTNVEGMGYAIPISNAIPMINELMNRETIAEEDQGFLGINADSAQNVTSDYSERFNMPVGVYINEVIQDSPAAKAGLGQGDIITGVDDMTIETVNDLANALSYKKAGQKIELKIQAKEGGAYVEKTLMVTLESKN